MTNESDPFAATNIWASERPESLEDSAVQSGPVLPRAIGRYRVERLLGKGGFGRVFLGIDQQLSRQVAIKVPHPRLVSDQEDIELYLAEARTVAGLDHHSIVPVYDVGSTDDFPCYVVSRYIEGGDLTHAMAHTRFAHGQSAELVAVVADALHHAHTKGIVHRDIKPGNILLNADNRPFVADFGLALQEVNLGRGPGFAGTPAYMSPEQARGEGHLVDGRSDVFSLAVVFYEMLTGRRPFRADKQADLLEQIVSFEPRPPRQLDDAIPREIERICLKALSKRASERYTTARDLTDELRAAIDHKSSIPSTSITPTGTEVEAISSARSDPRHSSALMTPTGSTAVPITQPTSSKPNVAASSRDSHLAKVVPKGLRSFDGRDAEFFLELLPGARDREGLPTSVRFWKTKLETGDPDKTFAVGLLYGPSGSGKSSLIKAGVAPHLAAHVTTAYVEAAPGGTESRILSALRKACPGLPEQELVESFASLRRGEGVPAGRKIVLFIDQFEQWLHAHRAEEDSLLVGALRQCDGARLQCVLLVRDDFWMSVTRFLNEIEVRLVEGTNSAAADLFSPRHARKVLASFGHAFGCIEADHEEALTDAQRDFLKQAVEGITESGTVIPVRLALFAEMIKSRPWTTQALQQVGGAGGIGAAFLEETFSSSTSPPEHRFHQKGARRVLKALMYLPGQATGIKGHMRSHDELLELSEYSRRPREFDDLIRILDSELRLITPTECESTGNGAIRDANQFYQLTHDYLVPSLREWLTRKQRETYRGRAELRLEERSEVWNHKPNSDYLPAWWEVVNILALTRSSHWAPPQKKMMRAAVRQQGVRFAFGLGAVILLLFAGWEFNGRARAATLVEQIVHAETRRVPDIASDLSPYLRWGVPLLKIARDAAPIESREALNTSLVLQRVDPSQADFLLERALAADPDEFAILRDGLSKHHERLAERLWTVLENPADETPRRIAAAQLLATSPTGKSSASKDRTINRWQKVAPFLASRLVDTAVHDSARYDALFKGLLPVGPEIVPALQSFYHDRKPDLAQRHIAMNIAELFAPDQAVVLADVLISSNDASRFAKRLPGLNSNLEQAVAFLEAEIAKDPEQALQMVWDDPSPDPAWTTPVADIVEQLEAAHGLLTPDFAVCQTMPLDQFGKLAERLRPSGYRPVKFRPYQTGAGVFVAAIWSRDRYDWRLASGLTAEDVRQKHAEWSEEGYFAVDVAGYTDGGFHYGLVSAKNPNATESFLAVGLTEYEIPSHLNASNNAHHDWRSIQFALDPSNEYRFSIVSMKEKQSGTNGLIYLFPLHPVAFEFQRKDATFPLSEICVSATPRFKSLSERYAEGLAECGLAIQKAQSDANAWFERGYLHARMGTDELALSDLNESLERNPAHYSALGMRAVVHARMNHADEALSDLTRLESSPAEKFSVAYYQSLASIFLGKGTDRFEQLEQLLKANPANMFQLINTAIAYAIGAEALAERDAKNSAALANRCLELLRQSLDKQAITYDQMRTSITQPAIQSLPGFQKLLSEETFDRSHIAMEFASANRLAVQSLGLNPAEHLIRCRQWASEGWRPISIGAASLGDGLPLSTVSAWQRPIVDPMTRDEFAARQARAAIALMSLGKSEKSWQLLDRAEDPGRRSILVHDVGRLRVDPKILIGRLDRETDNSRRQGLLLSIGQFPDDLIDHPSREKLISTVIDLFQINPDPGVHSACDWLLRKQGRRDDVNKIEKDVSSREPANSRDWYVNGQQQTLAVIRGPKEFEMGAPYYEPDKEFAERLHKRRIGRSFAISTKEVTNAEFLRFLAAHPELKHAEHPGASSPPDHPVGSVTWYEAAQYCNWLSEVEGLSSEQFCYPPVADIKKGMVLDKVVEKTGYRLPTESEWEFSCRAGTRTGYSFGASTELAAYYAWFRGNSEGRSHSTGLLEPNHLGLFDMHGNIDEWCQEGFVGNYPRSSANGKVEDLYMTAIGIMSGSPRTMRGSEFRNPAVTLRSAHRNTVEPQQRDLGNGFRIARTVSLSTVVGKE